MSHWRQKQELVGVSVRYATLPSFSPSSLTDVFRRTVRLVLENNMQECIADMLTSTDRYQRLRANHNPTLLDRQ